jgi:hypothetical protein
MILCIFMTENEDKLLHNILKKKAFLSKFLCLWKYVFKTLSIFKKIT